MGARFNRQDVVLGALPVGTPVPEDVIDESVASEGLPNEPFDWDVLPPGTTGQVLTVQAGGSIAWEASAGSSSIVTVGTIGTGVWQGTAISGSYMASTGLAINSCTSVITVDTPSAGAVTCNLATSNWHQITFAANTTITLSNVGTNQQFTLIIIQGGSGRYTATFSGMTIKWPGGAAPTLTTAVGGIDVLTFKQISSGNYYGFVAGAALA